MNSRNCSKPPSGDGNGKTNPNANGTGNRIDYPGLIESFFSLYAFSKKIRCKVIFDRNDIKLMKNYFLLLIIMTLFSTILNADTLEIGSRAPEVSAFNHEGNSVDLGVALNQGVNVVFFYPKAMTPGCTAQACSIRDAWDELQQQDLKVFGVSSDTAKTQAAFRDKHQLPFTLIADTDRLVSKAFGRGRWSRQAYIFKDGILIWKDTSASTARQAEDILKALEGLK